MSRFRRAARAKRGFFWTGQQGTIVQGTSPSIIELYNPSISALGDTKDMRHEKTILWLQVISSATLSRIGFALEHLQTDLNLAEQNILDPLSTDLDFFNKRMVMWGGNMYAPATGQNPAALYEMIESKRRIDAAQEAVALVINGSSTNSSVSYWARSLFSKRA